jgi:hypothetical protein
LFDIVDERLTHRSRKMDMRFPNQAHTTAASGFTTLLPGHDQNLYFLVNRIVQMLESMHEQQQRNQPPRYQLFVDNISNIAGVVGAAFGIVTYFV